MNNSHNNKFIQVQVVPFTIADAIENFTREDAYFRGTIMHGCNCKKVMGSGVAKWIRETFPAAYDKDCIWGAPATERLGSFTNTLETFQTAERPNVLIYNLYTQFGIREFNNRTFEYTKPFSLDAFRDAFTTALNDLYNTNIHIYSTSPLRPWNHPIFLPCIGAGLGGGDWLEIQTMILMVAKDITATLGVTVPKIYICIPV